MENRDDMQRLMEELLPRFYSHLVPNRMNIATEGAFIPFGCITKDFFEMIYVVLSAKQLLLMEKWRSFVTINRWKMLYSHEMYLEFLMHACKIEARFSDGVFDSLLGVSALVIVFNIEMLEETGVNFCELTVDIFMVIYEKSELKEEFSKHGGFERFKEYLHPEYLEWECYLNDTAKDSTVSVSKRGFTKNVDNKFDKELEYVLFLAKSITYNDIRGRIYGFLAREVLLSTKVRLPTLPSSDYLNAALEQKVVGLKETKRENEVVSKFGTTDEASISRTMASASESKTTALASKSGMTDETSISRTTASASESETTTRASESGTTVLASITGSTALASESGTTALISKSGTTAPATESETPTKASESGIMASASHSGTTASALNFETTTPVLQSVADFEESIMVEKTNIEWCDNIVRAVIKYNNSKSSNQENVNKQIQKADKILEALKDTIQSLIEVLED